MKKDIDINKISSLLPVTDYESMSKEELEKEREEMQNLLDSIPLEKHNEVDGIESYKEDLEYIKNLLKNM